MLRASARCAAIVVASMITMACSDESSPAPTVPTETEPPPPDCEPNCVVPGLQDDGCPAGEVAVDGGPEAGGSCRPAGTPPDMCAAGFVADGEMGCVPVLPATACPPGQMAVVGEETCRPVGDCGAAPWGNIATDGTTQFVDATYLGGDSDGTEMKPWLTIADGIAAAAPNAIVAIAEGSYVEDLVITLQPVRLWGRCAELVEVVGSGEAAVSVGGNVDGTEIRGLALTGAERAVIATAALDVVFEEVWVHHTGRRAFSIQDDQGLADITFRNSLLEDATEYGMFVVGSNVTVERSLIRNTVEDSTGAWGRGFNVLDRPSTLARSSLTVRSSVIDGNADMNIGLIGSDALIEASVIRGAVPNTADPDSGHGIYSWRPEDRDNEANLTIRQSAFEDNAAAGVVSLGSFVAIESTLVRGSTGLTSGGTLGYGLAIQEGDDAQYPSRATIDSSVVRDNQNTGIFIRGSIADISASVVRDNKPDRAAMLGGRGIGIQGDTIGGTASEVSITSSVVQGNRGIGVFVDGSNVSLDGVLVADHLPRGSGEGGRGVQAQNSSETGLPTNIVVRGSVFDRNIGAGLFLLTASANLERSVVRDTAARQVDGLLGDGLVVASLGVINSAVLTDMLFENSARVGVVSFGAAITLSSTQLECNEIDLNISPFNGATGTIDNQGGNRCGCGEETVDCKVLSSTLEAPQPFD